MILTVEASAAQARCDFRRKELSSKTKKVALNYNKFIFGAILEITLPGNKKGTL